jgi:hypothetical protein
MVVAGRVMKAANECTPEVALKPTRQRLDCIHAPANVLVVLSKISIADAVPVTVAVAVAVRRTLSPARGDERSAESVSPVDAGAPVAPRDGCGTLGCTGAWAGSVDPPAGEAGEGNVVSSHAAGELSSDFAGSAGHWVRPSGRDD